MTTLEQHLERSESYEEDLTLFVFQTNDATIAHVFLDVEDGSGEDYPETVFGTGTAKRMTGDRFDPRIGGSLAISRALVSLAEQLENGARELIGDD